MAALRMSKRVLIALFTVIFLYLIGVAVWSAAVVEELIEKSSVSTSASELSSDQITMLIKVEDPTFFDHIGVSLAQGQGWTTITSSVARDMFLFRTNLAGAKGYLQKLYAGIFACCKRFDVGRDVMAMILNYQMSKEEQLSYFISNTYFGLHNDAAVYGFKAASTVYYKKPLARLAKSEFVGLVAMLKAPDYFNPLKSQDAHRIRSLKIEKIISGECQPSGWFDTQYEHCSI